VVAVIKASLQRVQGRTTRTDSFAHLLYTITSSMSTRKSTQGGFASKSMFDVLQNDEPEEEEVEEEEVALDQVIE
jgi:hypothetical protein